MDELDRKLQRIGQRLESKHAQRTDNARRVTEWMATEHPELLELLQVFEIADFRTLDKETKKRLWELVTAKPAGTGPAT
jgi:hypothetical protein